MIARDRRAIGWGAAAVVTAIVVLRVLPWAVRWVEALRAETAERVETLARANEVLTGAAASRAAWARAFDRIVALGPHLVEGRSASDAQAALSDVVSFTASHNRMRVMRLDAVPDSASGPFGRVAVRAELESDIAGLTRFLRAIEAGDPLLTVSALSVQAPEAAGRLGGVELLRVEATVGGLYLPKGAK